MLGIEFAAMPVLTHGSMCSVRACWRVSVLNPVALCSPCAQDAMSEAVEGAELMLYGVSAKYKERWERHITSLTECFLCATNRSLPSQRQLPPRAQL